MRSLLVIAGGGVVAVAVAVAALAVAACDDGQVTAPFVIDDDASAGEGGTGDDAGEPCPNQSCLGQPCRSRETCGGITCVTFAPPAYCPSGPDAGVDAGSFCTSDDACADAGVANAICDEPVCQLFYGGPERRACQRGCGSAADCGPGLACNAAHRCVPATCAAPADCASALLTCGADGTCAPKPCVLDRDCGGAPGVCVNTLCSASLGQCLLPVP